MFSSLRRLKQMATRRKFQMLIQSFDDRIAAARAAHQPVRPIEREKAAYVNSLLERRA